MNRLNRYIINNSSKLIININKQNVIKQIGRINFTSNSSSVASKNTTTTNRFTPKKEYSIASLLNKNNNKFRSSVLPLSIKGIKFTEDNEKNLEIYKENYEEFKNENSFYFEFMNKFSGVSQYESTIEVYNDYELNFKRFKDIIGEEKEDSYIVTLAMSAYASLGMMDKCLDLYNSKLSKQSVVAYTILITGYLEKSDFENSMKWLEACLADEEIELDIGVFTSLIAKLSRSGQFLIVDMVLNQVFSKNLKLDTMFYNALIKSLSGYKGQGHGERLIKYVDLLKNDKNSIEIDTQLFCSIIDAFYFKGMHKELLEFYNQYHKSPLIEYSNNYLLSMFKTFHIVRPDSILEINNLWERLKRPIQSKHYFNYFLLYNILIEKGWCTKKDFNLPDFVENEITTHFNGNSEIFQKDITIINQIIRWHLHQDEVSLAWSIFQFTLTNSLADTVTFQYILKYLSIRSTEIIVYNNIKEIFTSSYFINLLDSNKQNYQKDIFIPILKKLSSAPQYREQKLKFVELMQKYTHEKLYFYNKSLGNN